MSERHHFDIEQLVAARMITVAELQLRVIGRGTGADEIAAVMVNFGLFGYTRRRWFVHERIS